MKLILITILLLALAPTTVLAETNLTLEERVIELETRVEYLEQYLTIQPSIDGYSGHGLSQTELFTVDGPFEIMWEAQYEGEYGTTFIVTVVYPDKGTTASSFGWHITSGNSTGQTWCYTQPGTYYLSINTEASWVVSIN